MKRLLWSVVVIYTTFLFSYCGDKDQKSESQDKEQVAQLNTTTSSEQPLANIALEDRADYYDGPPEMIIEEGKRYVATIKTAKGDIVVDLDAMVAPIHVNNFVFLAQQGFFDGLTFHRVEPNFVIQGGDPLGVGTGGPGYRIPAEIGLPHHQGVLAMARQADAVNPERESSGSQFYITLKATPFLDGQYSVFGRVTQGFDVVEKIQKGDVIERVDINEK